MYTSDQVKFWFTHAPTPSATAEKLTDFHAKAREFALYIIDNLPASQDTYTALDKLQEVVAWGNSSLTRAE